MQARQTVARQPDDPTWLAYVVYGDPRAIVSRVARGNLTPGLPQIRT